MLVAAWGAMRCAENSLGASTRIQCEQLLLGERTLKVGLRTLLPPGPGIDLPLDDEHPGRTFHPSLFLVLPRSRPLEHFTFEDLDPKSLDQYRRLFRQVHEGHPWHGLPDIEFLERLGGWRRDRATGKEGLTLAALLMLGKESAIRDPLAAPAYLVDYREKLDPANRWTDRIHPDGTWEANLFQFYGREGGFLASDNRRRWTTYRLVGDEVGGGQQQASLFEVGSRGDSEHKAKDSEHKAKDSEHYGGSLPQELADQARAVARRGRVPSDLMRRTILALCRGRFLSAEDLGALLARHPNGLRQRFLTPMVAEGTLHLRHPGASKRPDQAYTARDS